MLLKPIQIRSRPTASVTFKIQIHPIINASDLRFFAHLKDRGTPSRPLLHEATCSWAESGNEEDKIAEC